MGVLNQLIKKNADRLVKLTAVIICIIMVISYIITITNSNIMNRQIVIIGDHPYTVVVTAGDVKAHLALLRVLPERLTYLNSSEVIAGLRDHYLVIDESMEKLTDMLFDRYLADDQNVPALRESYLQLRDIRDEMLKMAETGNSTAQLKTYYTDVMTPKLDTLDRLVDTIVAGAGRKFGEYSALVTRSNNTITTMAGILSLAILIVIYQYILRLKQKTDKEKLAVRTELEVEQRANAAKSRFLFNMSHDIRTPMNAIIGLTAIAAMDINKKEKVKECLTKIAAASRQLLGLINDVLDMSRIESGKIYFNEEDFKLPDLLDDFISIAQPQAAEKGLDFAINVCDLIHERVTGDAVHIKRILVNITGNALKFTPAGGQIRVTVRELPPTAKNYGNYQFTVQDTGIGMTEDFLKKIFQPFERAETSTRSKTEGTGLGMAITKNIVDMMGGSVEIESEVEKGTTVRVTIPVKLQAGEDAAGDFIQLRDLRSLVVDDDEIACENTVRMIQEIGMSSEWVLSGAEAVEKVQVAHAISRDYHIIIVDWLMPDMDGMQTVRSIREIVGEEVPIIIVTAYDWSEIESEARDAGVNAFLSKPVFKSRLYHVMQDLTAEGAHRAETGIPDKVRQYVGRVLLVEDNEINMEIAEEFIGCFGVTVEKVWDGQEAVDRIKEVGAAYYDLVFMDIQMPVMDGYEATRQIRLFEKESGGHVPVVAMSANAFVEEINKGYESGMDSYITKPAEFATLDTVLRKYLASGQDV